MSKFLKFIVHFIVICTILCVVALAVPPFFGITTVIRDDATQVSNLPMGSVTYAIPVKAEEIAIGQSILVDDEDAVFSYKIASLDLNNHMGTVVDSDTVSGDAIYVAVKNFLPKIVITVPYVGYLLVATESIEGLIVLGLAVLFLIILYVIAELWKKDSADDDDDYEDMVRVKSRKELKREEKAREKRMKAEDKEFLREEKIRKKEERKNRKIIKTGGFVDEIYEDEMEREEDTPRRRRVNNNVQSATSEAHELLKKEIAAATADEFYEKEAPARRTADKQPSRPKKTTRPQQREPMETRKMAVPRYSAAQLAEKAKQEGDAPDIIKDEITNITLFDYSDIIGGDEEI